MVVEFVGLPGVGKSFLCHSLKDVYDGAERARVRVVIEETATLLGSSRALLGKLWRACRFAATHAGTTGELVGVLRARKPTLRGGRLSKLVNLLSEVDRSARVGSTETVITEQGVLQAIWSLEMRSDESVHVELMLVLSRWLPDGAVFVETEREEYESRLRRREGGRSHFDRLESDGLREAIERGLRCMHEILDVWTLRPGGAERLDFRNDRDARVGDIVEWVDTLRVPGPSAPLRVRGVR